MATLAFPADAAAQRRAIRRPPVRSVVHVRVFPYRPFYYSPFFHFHGFHGAYAGWYSWYGWPYWPPYPSPYYGYYRPYIGEARLQVQPREAEVFIDGYYVGRVDDFDGWSQRLRVEPGEHVLEIYMPGYRTYRQPVLFRPGATLKIEHVMQPLAPGEPEEPRPAPSPGAAPARRTPYPPSREAPRSREAPPPREEPPSREEPAVRPEAGAEYGSVAIRVQPPDAEVFVDGERWVAPETGDLTLQLAEGRHRLEVRKPGFRTYSADVDVRRGQTTSINVSLAK